MNFICNRSSALLPGSNTTMSNSLHLFGKAPDKACCDPSRDPAAEEKGESEADHFTINRKQTTKAAFLMIKSDCSVKMQLHHAEQDKQRWRMDKAQLEQTLQENKERMEKLEGYWMEAQSLCQAVDEHLKETQAQYQALERKYSKAKRLIKEYQQK